MINIALTPAQFAAKSAQLKAEQGITLDGSGGTISHGGFSASYTYDGAELSINLIKHPWFVPESACESHLLAWFAGS